MIKIIDYKDKVFKFNISQIINNHIGLLKINEWIAIDLDRLKIITKNSEDELVLINE